MKADKLLAALLCAVLMIAGAAGLALAETAPAAPPKKPFEERAWFNRFGNSTDE